VTSPKGVGGGGEVVKGEVSERNNKRREREQDMGFELWPRHHSSPRRPIENPLLMSGFNIVHSRASKLTLRFLALQ
jgi:hypothetical protein